MFDEAPLKETYEKARLQVYEKIHDTPGPVQLSKEDREKLSVKLPPCILHILSEMPAKSEKINYNKLVMSLVNFFQMVGWNEQESWGQVQSFIEKYPHSETYHTPEKRKKHWKDQWNYLLNRSGYGFDCSYLKGLGLPGSAFNCSACVKTNESKQKSQSNDDIKKDRKLDALSNFESVTLESIYAKKIEETPIITNFIYEGEQTVIYGDGGVGKSLITEDISMALGSGMKYLWDTFEIPNFCASMFFQSENGRSAVYQRTAMKCEGNSQYRDGLKNIIYASQYGNIEIAGHIGDKYFRDSLVDFAKRTEDKENIKIKVIFWDPMISFHDAEENDNSRMRTTLDHILLVSNEINATPIIVHHSNKEKGLRGATAIQNWARNIIKLEDISHKGEKLVKFTQEKCNNHEKFEPFVLTMDEHLNFSAIEYSATIPKGVKKRCEKVKEALQLLGDSADSKSQLINQYKEITGLESIPTIHRHINEAVKHKYIDMEYYKEGDLKKARFWIDVKPYHF
jgi:hypothetical protein